MSALFSANHIHVYEKEFSASSEPLEIVSFMARELSALEGLQGESVVKAALERENDEPTAIGRELAIPHARVAGVPNACMYIMKTAQAVSWGDKEVRLVILTVVPDNCPNIYLEIMSSVVRWRMQAGIESNNEWEQWTVPMLYSSILLAFSEK